MVLLGQDGLDETSSPSAIQDKTGDETASRVARPAGARAAEIVVVPESYLRRWDPVTLFFPVDTGPAAGGPEDAPERHATLTPSRPGAWTWLDARTLQFRPADPWPPLERFTVQAGGRSFRLATLLAPPLSSRPAANATGVAPVEEIALTFSEPLPPEALARALAVEIRPLPGFQSEGEGARFLARDDFEVKSLERAAPADPATYVLALRAAIPTGHRVFVRLRLTLDDPPERAFWELAFSTAEPFRALRFGCRARQLPVVPGGARYSDEQALACEDSNPAVVVDFSADPGALGPLEARNLVRISPAVPGFAARLSGRRLEITGDFARESGYRVTLVPAPLADAAGRPLDLAAPNELTLSFPRASAYLRLAASTGVVERKGPRRLPLVGRGEERLDLRIVPIDPFDRGLFPFPAAPVEVDEAARPPGPGEAPEAWTRPDAEPGPAEIARRIQSLATPPLSRLVDLPLRRDKGSASFGLDLGAALDALAGPGAPGTYLVGIRRLGEGTARSWMRLQATDLALTTLEEPRRTVFAVTSLASAKPVAGAVVTVEGVFRPRSGDAAWTELFRGTTGADGRVAWEAPGATADGWNQVRRIAVVAGADRLVLDPDRAPEAFADNRWSESGETWLQWTQQSLEGREAGAEWLAHLFPERPIHRPEEPVHLKGYVRIRERGRLRPETGDVVMVIEGPGGLVWRYPLTPSALGAVYLKFAESELPTGVYRAYLELAATGEAIAGSATFRKEAYRLPRFEVRLDAPERAPLDREFDVALLATYYAGGRVAARPVEWRVTQFPLEWTPKAFPGFLFSSDARFARERRFESTAALERADTTDEDGAAKLTLNPAIEPTAQPRTYVVEATVVDADEQTVTATRQIAAVPPFLVGVSVPRYLERAERVSPQVLVVGPDEKPVAGERITVRLVRREWHAFLRASDFTDGVARYVTEVVDEKVAETTVVSAAAPLAVPFDLPAAGVYVLELEGHDRLGRAQTVAVDFFAGGEGSVTWERPASAVFRVVPDRARYAPGETARLVLESPFQTGEAIAVVEAPEGNRYEWLPMRGGKAVFDLPVEGPWTPKVPVHFLLMRGRLSGAAPRAGAATDLGRPVTFGATVWLDVEPLAHRLAVELAHPTRARPGQTVEIEVRLKDPAGAPLAGEVTLWLVDQAVMALAREARLDPVPSFLTEPATRFTARDTRALVFGDLAFAELPGGDEGEEARSLLDRQTVRKNFQAVPFYAPAIRVGPDGVVRVPVTLSDDLTNFLVRAKAVSGDERFGFATGKIEIRQPVVVQPSLPRFVRPGDRFAATAVARIVEGEGGPGTAEARVDGLELVSPAKRTLDWTPNRAERLDFEVVVPTPPYDAEGNLARTEVSIRIGAERSADGAGDALEVRLPIRDDRDRVRIATLATLDPAAPLALPEAAEAPRPGSLRRELLVSSLPGVVEMAAGLDFLLEYPYGCTEQRLAASRAQLALSRFRAVLGLTGGERRRERAIADTLAWLQQVQQPSGLFAFWPGSRGSVALTAWAVELLAEAREAKQAVDAETEEVERRAIAALEQALRSDYAHFLDGESWAERTWALRALARAGRFDAGYGNELARRAQLLDLENVANVVLAFDRAGKGAAPALAPLEEELWRGFVVRLHQGREIYGGLQQKRQAVSGLILPSETRTLAEMTRALAGRTDADAERRKLEILTAALVGLGRGDGWGSTNASSSAILALVELLGRSGGAAPASVEVVGAAATTLDLSSAEPAARWISRETGGAAARLRPGASGPVTARAELTYLPAAPGSQAAPRREGFVVAREQLVYRGESGTAPERFPLEIAGRTLELVVGEVVEDHLQVVNPADRHYVAVVVPLAAGMEPLNPSLETAPPEAKPAGALTLAPTYAAYLDDQVAFFYDTLPQGTYDFYFRTRAQIPGTFQQPPAKAEMMYDGSVAGTGAGAAIRVDPAP
jgi:uncharacterized protein YfaS (alpha-2-macroglobulin family)